MAITLTKPSSGVRVLFDEAHGESWSIRPSVAERMQPAHPADSSLARAAAALAARGFAVAAHDSGRLDGERLAGADVLVIAHPSEPDWEATTNGGSPRLTPAEIEAIVSFVAAGGGLIVLAETEEAKYGANLNDLLSHFGLEIANATIQDYDRSRTAPSWILPELDRAAAVVDPPEGDGRARPDLLAGVDEFCMYRAGALALAGANGSAPRVLATASPSSTHPGAPLVAVAEHGRGRIVVLADSDLFGDDCIADADNLGLWLNLLHWLAIPALAHPAAPPASAAAQDPAWRAMSGAIEELRLLQGPDGALENPSHDADRARGLVSVTERALTALAPHFPHQASYLDALRTDLDRWVASGFGKPDFAASLEEFRPERQREDGIEHLVLFPMYKQNASRDTCFEALIVRVPWPDWIAEIEAQRYDNAKVVPVELVGRTAGYDSECAVLFPETVSTAQRPAEYHFGAIFCDREAARFRDVCSRAVSCLGLNPPPDAAALLSSPELSRDAYILWDLIHDRTHMRGDLPFDPFMIRQRSPYWMYALEELRCDLTAYGEALNLEADGFAFAANVRYAILFDRLFRFPITGSRSRNYDGLGGQLLFAILHHDGCLRWTDNRMTVDWKRLPAAVEALRARVEELYHSGIDRSKVAQWIAAHDLVAEFVPPAPSSRWAADRRNLPDAAEPKELVDLVLEDEFPLSLFYEGLQRKLNASAATVGA